MTWCDRARELAMAKPMPVEDAVTTATLRGVADCNDVGSTLGTALTSVCIAGVGTGNEEGIGV